jgi:carbon monoxide dehydrogenase subunit G
MTTQTEKTIQVDVPVTTAYNQWTQFEQFPRFMSGVEKVTQLDDKTLHWVAEIAGVKREWDATIIEQSPDRKIAWAAIDGATNAGAVYFQPVGADRTEVRLSLEFEPEGLVEKAGDSLNVVERQVESDLKRFKELIESEGQASGAWRGSVNEGAAVGTPGVEAAAPSEGDSGKSGISGKAVLAGAAAAVAGVAIAKSRSGSSEEDDQVEEEVIVVEVIDEDPTQMPRL